MTEEVFRERTRQGFEALQSGDPHRAVELLEEALQVARDTEDQDLMDEGLVNLSQAQQEAGDSEAAEEGLREILMRTRRDDIVLSAALTIARTRKSFHDLEKAQFYLDRAISVADRLGPEIRQASVLTERANLFMHANQFDLAAADYSRVVDLLEGAGHRGYALTVALDNLGYCLVLMDRMEEGVPLLERSIREAEEYGVMRYVAEANQDLCFARLKMKEPEKAEEPGRKALAVADEEDYADIRKNALYLLGESCCLQGRDLEARGYFRRLQEFYPGMPDLGQFLSTYDISAMITLKEF